MFYIDAELAGHVNEPGVKLQSLCVSGFFCLLCACLPSHFGVNWPTTLSENKDGVHFYPQIWMP